MTTNWPYPSSYPTAFDDFTTALIDNVDEVIANHPNSMASAIMALQHKVNLDNFPIRDIGGVQFDPLGRASNPASPGEPCVWVDNSGGPGFSLMYTDDLGVTIPLGSGGGPLGRIQVGLSGSGTVDLYPYTSPGIGSAYLVPWNIEEYKDGSYFNHSNTINPERISVVQAGNYKIHYLIAWENQQAGQPKDVGAVISVNGVEIDRSRVHAATVDGLNGMGGNTLSSYELTLGASDILRMHVWNHGSPGIAGGTLLHRLYSWMRIERT